MSGLILFLLIVINTAVFSFAAEKIDEEILSALLKNKISKICVYDLNKSSDIYFLKENLAKRGIENCEKNGIEISGESLKPEEIEQLTSLYDIDGIIFVDENDKNIKIKALNLNTNKAIFQKIYEKKPQITAVRQIEVTTEKTEEIKKEKKVFEKNQDFRPEKRNSIGFLLGVNHYDYDFSLFKEMSNNSTGSKSYSDRSGFNAEVFYAHKRGKSQFIASFGFSQSGYEEFTSASGKEINIDGNIKYLYLGYERKFLGNLGFMAAGGAFISEYKLSDPVPLMGIDIVHTGFKNSLSGPLAVAGLSFDAGNFLFKVGVMKMFIFGEKKFTTNVTGGVYSQGNYSVIIKNKNSVDFKGEGVPLSSGEEYLELPEQMNKFFALIGYKFSF